MFLDTLISSVSLLLILSRATAVSAKPVHILPRIVLLDSSSSYATVSTSREPLAIRSFAPYSYLATTPHSVSASSKSKSYTNVDLAPKSASWDTIVSTRTAIKELTSQTLPGQTPVSVAQFQIHVEGALAGSSDQILATNQENGLLPTASNGPASASRASAEGLATTSLATNNPVLPSTLSSPRAPRSTPANHGYSLSLVSLASLTKSTLLPFDRANTIGPMSLNQGPNAQPTTASANNNVNAAIATSDFAVASTTNALSVLESAVPSSVIDAIQSHFSTLTSHPPQQASPNPSDRISVVAISPSTSSTKIAPLTTLSTSTTQSQTKPASTFLPSSTSSGTSISSSTVTSAPPVTQANLPGNAVAGVATGVTAGAVLIILAVVYFLRRRQQRKPPFGPRASKKSVNRGVYPEVAWLYDPAPTPPGALAQNHSDQSNASLLPPGHERGPEMEESNIGIATSSPREDSAGQSSPLLVPPVASARDRSPSRSPNASPRTSRESWANTRESWTSSPLLAPQMPSSRSESPQGPRNSSPRASRSSLNPAESGRPLTAIFEENKAQ